MKKRILFVDDDAQLLKSLKRMLWNEQDRWEAHFTTSGEQALDLFARHAFDVVVTDIRMPGMEGHQLLAKLRKSFPWVMRILLSGVSDRQLIMRSVPYAHQFLTKPVTALQLVNAIERGCRLRDTLLSDELKHLIGEIDALPAQPDVYARLVKTLEDESSGTDAVADIICQDMALAADVLKLVNSSFFAPRARIRDVAQAVTLLGFDTIRGLVLGIKMLAVFDTAKFPDFSFPLLWEHSLHTALFARAIAEVEDLPPDVQDDCFIAGMLHDLGKFVMADKLYPRYKEAVASARRDNIPLVLAERDQLGVSHAEAGAYLLGLWGLSDSVLEAVAYHHDPSLAGLQGMSAVMAVHAGNALEHELVVRHPGYATHPLDMACLESMGLAGRVDRWREACLESLELGED